MVAVPMTRVIYRHAMRAAFTARLRTTPFVSHHQPMRLNQAPVGPSLVRLYSSESSAPPPTITTVTAKVAVELRAEDLDESFVKGWGKGGQKINKVRNCVLLKHIPTGLHVRCQETRSLDGNRRIARRLLLQKLDDQVNGALSKRNQKISKLRKKKANRRNKSKQKYAAGGDDTATHSDSDGSDGEEEESGADNEDDEEDDVDIVDFDVDEHAFRSKKKK